MADEKEKERRKGPDDRRVSRKDRRGSDRIVEESPRRQKSDRRKSED